jgi:hypothetical protein
VLLSKQKSINQETMKFIDHSSQENDNDEDEERGSSHSTEDNYESCYQYQNKLPE